MIKNYVKNGVFISSLLGIYYLFVFTIFEGIPFPLDLSVLPTVFLVQGVLGLLITFVILLYSTASGLALFDFMEISYSEIFYVKPNWIEDKYKNLASIINFSIFFCLTPLVSYIAFTFKYQWVEQITFFCLLAVPALFSYYALTPSETFLNEKGKCIFTFRYLKTVFTFFCIGLFSIVSLIIFIKYVEFVFSIKSDYQFFVAITIFVISNYIILMPIKKMDGFQRNAQQYSTNKVAFLNILRIPAFYVYFLAILASLFPSVAAKTSAMSFKLLNMGGGIDRSYYFTRKARITIPPDLIEHCNSDDYCVTKNLHVILDLGGALYVKGNYFDREGTIVSLPRPHLSVVNIGKEKSKN